MDAKNIRFSDWHRILFGSASPAFLVEVLVRGIVMYVALVVTLRYMGKRMNGQISITELAVMISLGAIISLPVQAPKQGILEGFVLLFLIYVFQRGLATVSFHSHRFEQLVHGRMCILVKDGVLQLDALARENIGKNQLFAQLRNKNVGQLGELDRVYLEANGAFSIFAARSARPGLSTLPGKDRGSLDEQERVDDLSVCLNCGFTTTHPDDECRHCHHRQWTDAVR